MKRVLPIILLFVLGCTYARYNLEPIAYKQKAKRYSSSNVKVIVFNGKDTDLMLFGYRDKSEVYIYSCIINKTANKNFDFIPEKIKALGLSKTKGTTRLTIYSAQEYINKKKNGEKQAQLTVALCSAINLMKAIRAKNYSKNFADISGNLGGAIFSANEYDKDAITFSSFGEVPDAQQRAMHPFNLKYDGKNQLYESTLLKKTTIPPSSYLEGFIIIDTKDISPEKYVIMFSVGIDSYKIILNPAKVEKK